jgi:hypothetical protein
MCEPNLESASLRHGTLDRLEQVVIQVDTSTAHATHNVMVVSAFGVVVYEVVSEPGPIHATQFLQQLQRAVYRGLVHTLHTGLDIVDYLFRLKVSIRVVDDIKNHPTLWRQSKTVLLQGMSAAHALCNQLRL